MASILKRRMAAEDNEGDSCEMTPLYWDTEALDRIVMRKVQVLAVLV